MGQILLPEKIGALSQSGGVATVGPSIINIGGQQYRPGTLSLTLPAMTANTLYMLYIVLVGGVPTLVQDVNINSVGPVGYSIWRLAGAYYSNGVSTPAFWTFVNIYGSPESSGFIPYSATPFNLNATPSGTLFTWKRIGSRLFFDINWALSGTGGSGSVAVGMPLPTQFTYLASPSSTATSATGYVSTYVVSPTTSGFDLMAANLTLPSTIYASDRGTGRFAAGSDYIASSQVHARGDVEVASWSTTQLFDL